MKTDKRTDNYGLRDAIFCNCNSIFMLSTDATRQNLTEPTRELDQRSLQKAEAQFSHPADSATSCGWHHECAPTLLNNSTNARICYFLLFRLPGFVVYPCITLVEPRATSVMQDLISPCLLDSARAMFPGITKFKCAFANKPNMHSCPGS